MKQTINIYDMFLVETSLWWLILCGRLIFQVPFPTISNCESMVFFYLSQYTGFIIWSVSPFTFSQILQSQARFRHEMLTTFLAYFSDVLFKFVAIWTTNTSQRTCHHCACCLIRRFFLFCFPFIRLRLLHGLRPCIISLQLN